MARPCMMIKGLRDMVFAYAFAYAVDLFCFLCRGHASSSETAWSIARRIVVGGALMEAQIKAFFCCWCNISLFILMPLFP